MCNLIDSYNAPGDDTEADAETIRAFRWVDDDAPLPVNPDDPDAVSIALLWATGQYRRHDSEYFLALNSAGWRPGDAEILRRDRDVLGRFKAALMRSLHAMRQRDRNALSAWIAGEPIRGEVTR